MVSDSQQEVLWCCTWPASLPVYYYYYLPVHFHVYCFNLFLGPTLATRRKSVLVCDSSIILPPRPGEHKKDPLLSYLTFALHLVYCPLLHLYYSFPHLTFITVLLMRAKDKHHLWKTRLICSRTTPSTQLTWRLWCLQATDPSKVRVTKSWLSISFRKKKKSIVHDS